MRVSLPVIVIFLVLTVLSTETVLCFGIRSSKLVPSSALMDLDRISKTLPPIPDPNSDPADDVFRNIKDSWPTKFIHFLRDTGAAGWIQDSLFIVGVPAILPTYPDMMKNFLTLSNFLLTSNSTFSTEYYGSHPRQYIDILKPSQGGNGKLIVFAHGGAWGSGKPWMYRLVATPFIEKGYTVGIWGYRTYPITDLNGQIQDLVDCLCHMKNSKEYKDISVVAHSSGAHVSAMALFQRNEEFTDLCDELVAISGVYDIPDHYQWESCRGVEEISPMKPICGEIKTNWIQYSPTRIVNETIKMPRLLIVHGILDKTVPYTSSTKLAKALYIHELEDLNLT